MQSITHSQLQELIGRIPDQKLPLAYRFLQDLAEDEHDRASPHAAFLRLPLEERSRLLAQQAQEMMDYYEQTAPERQDWQSGDFWDGH